MKNLQDMTVDELQTLMEKNGEFKNLVYESAYEDSMFSQEEQARLMGCEVFEYHDHYCSFYYTIPRDGAEKLAHKLDRDYMSDSTAKIYDKLNELVDKWENMTYDEQDENQELYERIENVGDALADAVTVELRCYEQITDEQMREQLELIADGERFGGFETDGTVVYEHITKTYK